MIGTSGLTGPEPYLIRFSVVDGVDIFASQQYRNIFTDSLQYCIDHKSLILYAWVLMSNHAHLVAQSKPDFRLYEIIRDLKKFTSKKIVEALINSDDQRKDWMLYRFHFSGHFDRKIKNYRFWEEGNQPLCCESPALLQQCIEFVHNNPVRAGIITEPAHYRHSSAVNYLGNNGIITGLTIPAF